MKPQKILERRSTSSKSEKDWLFFSIGLMMSLCSDYISLRFLYYTERITTSRTILPKLIEVAEKSLKLFVSVNNKTQTAISDFKTKYGHNIEKLRRESASFNTVFNDADICEFTCELQDQGGMLYQYFRYGSQETTSGMYANINKLIPIVDKIFFSCLLLLPENEKRRFNSTSLLKKLLTDSQFDQSFNRDLLKAAIYFENAHVSAYFDYCKQLDEHYGELVENLTEAKRNGG